MKARLMEDMKQAMKSKDKLKVDTIRMVNAAIKNTEINEKREMAEDDVISIIIKEIKLRRDAMEEYKKAERPDDVAKLEQEIEILLAYMPEQLSEEQVRDIVSEVVNQTSAQGPKDMGKVMAALMPRVKGKADGKLVSNIVKEFLS